MKKIKFLHECDFHYLMKTFRIMRITVFLLIATILQTFANDTYSQKTRLSLDFPGTKLVDVLDEIESKTEFYFLFNEKLIDTDRKVNMSVKNEKIDVILDQLFEGTDVVYNIADRKIVLAPSFLSENQQQQKSVSGTITDESGQPLPGVTVVIKGTTQGTVTNADGYYYISNIPDNVTLRFTYVGMNSQEVVVDNQTSINVIMIADVLGLDEVVVTGYSQQRKKDITGSVSVVDMNDIAQIPSTSLTQRLQGQVSGVVIGTSGTPNSQAMVRIRGIGSVNSNGPLYVIDGVSTRNQDLNSINPNDIESVQVLKDASSASIYGSRASNGVIVITTKKGKTGVPKISYDGFTGISVPLPYFDLLDTYDLINLEWKAKINAYDIRDIASNPSHSQFGSGLTPTFHKYIIPTASDGPFTIDDYNLESNRITEFNVADGNYWHDATVQNAIQQSHQLSMSGSSESMKYLFGINYLNKEGAVKYTYYKRYAARINTEFKPFKRMTIGENLSISSSTQNISGGTNNENSTYGAGVQMVPWIPIYDIAGNFAGTGAAESGKSGNPLATLYRAKDDDNNNLRLFANIYAEYDILKSLTFRTSGGIDQGRSYSYGMAKKSIENAEPTLYNQLNELASYGIDYQWSNTLNFQKTYNDAHNLTVLIGSEAIWSGLGRSMSGYRQGFEFEDNTDTWVLSMGDPANQNVTSDWNSPVYMFGLFSRIDYNFNDRYLISGTVRRDGSSRFSEKNRYGVFPAVSAGWRISNEKFMDDVNFVDDLKLRIGFGTTGNSEIPRAFNWASSFYSDARYTSYDLNGANITALPGFAQQTFGNPDTKWETSKTLNIGMDWTLLQGLFGGSIEFYNRATSDMLVPFSYSSLAGEGSAPYVNFGDIENKGFDIDLRHVNKIGNVGYNIGVNISHYTNNVVRISKDVNTQFQGAYSRLGYPTITQADSPMSSFYGYKIIGFYESEDDVLNYKGTTGDREGHTVLPLSVKNDAQLIAKQWVGKWKYEDIDGNGIIDLKDRAIIGNPHPDFTGGANLGLNYKNFDLSAFFYFSVGNDIFNYTKVLSDFWLGTSNRSTTLRDKSWEPGKTDAVLPILDHLDTQSGSQSNTYYIEDGSFLRLQLLTLGYTVPIKAITKLRVFVQGDNLFTVTKYSGLDPDITNQIPGDGGDLTRGIDWWNWPKSKEFIFGVNVIF